MLETRWGWLEGWVKGTQTAVCLGKVFSPAFYLRRLFGWRSFRRGGLAVFGGQCCLQGKFIFGKGLAGVIHNGKDRRCGDFALDWIKQALAAFRGALWLSGAMALA